MNHSRSSELRRRALKVIPLGVQTLSKSHNQFVDGLAPDYVVRARGNRLWDADGNEWLDYPMALGPVVLGYADPRVDEAISRQLRDGIVYSFCHPLEIEVAERITELCPGVEAVRFGKSGSDALSAAVRAARALTGRDIVIAMGYHGWHDWFIGSTTRSAGVPRAVADLTMPVPYGDLDRLGDALRLASERGGAAAVVLEPSGATVPPPGFLAGVIEQSRAAGAVSVFDEVITGFRLAPGGARERYGVTPDLSCYGKALGNGMPISAVGGSWEVMAMFEEIFFSGTHGGETLSLAAAATVLDVVRDGSVLDGIGATGAVLLEAFRCAINRHGIGHRVSLGGEPHRAVVGFPADHDQITKSFVQQCFLEVGIVFNGSMFISEAHTAEDIERTAAIFENACARISTTDDLRPLLRGDPVAPVFRVP